MSIFSKKQSYVGLDIGTSSIKLVELRREGKEAVRLATYASAEHVEPLTEGSNGNSVERVAAIVREMIARSGVSSSEVVAALPSLSVFSTILQLPDMSEDDLEKAVTYEAKNYVPSPLKDVVLGWTIVNDDRKKNASLVRSASASVAVKTNSAIKGILGRKKTEDENNQKAEELKAPMNLVTVRRKTEVFMTAAPKDLVARYSAVIDRLRLKMVALEIESFPLSRSLLKNNVEPTMLIDIGAWATNFSVVDGGYLRLNQSADIGGCSLTKAIGAKLGISEEQATARKIQKGLFPEAGDEEYIITLKKTLNEIIERSVNLQKIFERGSKRRMQKTVLIGGGANLKGIAPYWQEQTGVPTEIGNPWKGIRVPAILQNKISSLGSSFAVAVGLALREFDDLG